MTSKSELRAHALAHMASLRNTPQDLENAAQLFQDHVDVTKGMVVAAYWPMADEFDVRYIIHDLLGRGVRIALPVCSKEKREMSFALWDGKDNLVRGTYGVYVPPTLDFVRPDIVIVPMLAFDQKGNRLGRGAGHYDATLAALRKTGHIQAIGVAFAEQAVLFALPTEAHDERLDMIVTPAKVYDFRK